MSFILCFNYLRFSFTERPVTFTFIVKSRRKMRRLSECDLSFEVNFHYGFIPSTVNSFGGIGIKVVIIAISSQPIGREVGFTEFTERLKQ